MRTAILAVLLAVSIPATAFAGDPAATAAPASLTKSGKTLICRYKTHEGMLIGRPVCMTKENWELALYKAQHEVSDFQTRHYSR